MTKLVDLPKRIRGNYENKFKTVEIESNHYYVNLENLETIFTYKLGFNPQISQDNKPLRMSILKKAMPMIQSMIFTPVISGMTIYSIRKPNFPETEFKVEEGER